MKKIIYVHPQTKLVAVCEPVEGGRLVSAITHADGSITNFTPPVAASFAAGGWPRQGVSAKWAETEDEFTTRIKTSNTPEGSVIADSVPVDFTFHKAWKIDGKGIVVDIHLAKGVAHDIRRAKRSDAFAPHDDVIAKRIPGAEESAEAERVKVREKFAVMQVAIDTANTVDDLVAALSTA